RWTGPVTRLQAKPCSLRRWTDVSFLFQAEDGIRDFHVTGVQTCALPILSSTVMLYIGLSIYEGGIVVVAYAIAIPLMTFRLFLRSEERRVGKECRSRWSRCQ